MMVLNYIKTHISALSLILSILVAWTIFPITVGFPMLPFAVLFAGVSTLIYIVKKNKSWVDSVIYLGILSLSFFTLYRANGFLQFFDFIFIIFFISVLVRPLIDIDNIFSLLLSPLTVFFKTIASENIFKNSLSLPKFMNKENYLKEVVLTIIVTAIVLFITVPLLASANPLFSHLLQNAFKFLNLNWLWRILITDSLVIYAFRIVALLFFAYVIPRAVSITAQGIKEYGTFQAISINYLAPKIVLAGTLIVFFITQLQLYFASPELLQSLGYTNSRLTNEVFAQVTIVAFVVLLLAYLDKSRKTWNKRITYFLLLESFFLIAIAFKSVYDYSSLHGLTQKRLWGYASMIWLTGAVGAYSYHFYKKTAVNVFIKQILAFSVVVVFFINVLNFDHLIYHTAKPSTIAGIDYEYLSKLSVDAHYYNELLPKFMKEIQANSEIDESKVQPALRMIFYIEELRKKYGEKKNLNSFNLAEYQEFKVTEHINVLEFRKIIEDKEEAKRLKEQSLQPTPFVAP